MKKLKNVLQCKWFYYIFLIVSLLFSLWSINKPLNSYYSGEETIFTCVITSIENNNGKVVVKLRSEETLRGTYFLKENEEFIYEIGDLVEINGKLEKPKHNTIFGLFDYYDYLKLKKESWLLQINSIRKIGESSNYFDIIKRNINRKLDSYDSKDYLKVFLLGDQTNLNLDVVSSYRENGISHLFSISGMHLSFLSGILLFLISRINKLEKVSYLIICIVLISYMFLVGCSASVVRACIFFVLRYIFSLLKIKIPISYIFLFMVSLVLFINPSFLLDVGFQYSISISYFLIIRSNNISNNYFLSMLEISTLSFLVGLPISLYYFYQVNFFSILYNLIFVPLVSLIVFPLSFITFILPFFDSLLYKLVNIMEGLSLFLSNIQYGKVIFMKPKLWWIIIYYLLLFLFNRNVYIKVTLFTIIIFLYFYPQIVTEESVLMIDVGQGDSSLIQFNGKTILMDTGGKVSKYSSNSISNNTLIPFFKSKGIRKINYLILTHGDYDHMGEAINLVNNFKIEKVIFNCGPYNDLEKELIKVLDKKHIKYYSCIKELNIDKNKLYFLQTKEYDNENDNSNVIYTEIDGYKFMFMGDASSTTEREILEKYNLPDIDVLKVGHHGSRTSSSKEFINEINPKYSIISVGKNNRYGHPNEEVLNNLENTKIYRTDQDGSIMFKIKNNQLKIETCTP